MSGRSESSALGLHPERELLAMKVICSYCGKDMAPRDALYEGERLSHSICPDCIEKATAFLAQPLTEFLDRFAAPVLIVDEEGRCRMANSEAFTLVGKTAEEACGELCGDVFECKWAELPGGCGNTIHCKSCTLRLTVMETLATGRSHENVEAYPDLHYLTGDMRVRFLISTGKVGDAVFLRIVDVKEEKRPASDEPEGNESES